jgi:hypothetical protein
MIIHGGFFQKGMRLKDYWDHLSDEETFIVHDIFFDILEGLYDNNFTCLTLTDRPLADLLAAIHAEIEDKDYSYTDFYG